jgi:hypothetical protein
MPSREFAWIIPSRVLSLEGHSMGGQEGDTDERRGTLKVWDKKFLYFKTNILESLPVAREEVTIAGFEKKSYLPNCFITMALPLQSGLLRKERCGLRPTLAMGAVNSRCAVS